MKHYGLAWCVGFRYGDALQSIRTGRTKDIALRQLSLLRSITRSSSRYSDERDHRQLAEGIRDGLNQPP